MKKKISITIGEGTLKGIDSMIDGIYIRNRSQAIEFLLNTSLSEKKSAVILCGGSVDYLKISSTEYRPTTFIGKQTVIEMAVKKLKQNGLQRQK